MPPSKRRFRAALTLPARYDHGPVVGLPSAAFAITNSQRRSMDCPRKWWWSYGLGLESKPSTAMKFGSAFDEVMGSMLEWYKITDSRLDTEDLETCPYCIGQQCPKCEMTGLGFLSLQVSKIREEQQNTESDEDYDDMIVRLTRAVHGWIEVYDEAMVANYTVVDVQPMIASPVISPNTGSVYKSKIPVFYEGQGVWRLASGFDRPEDVSFVTMPFYQVCKLDAIVINKNDGKLWVWETKTSANPEQFSKNLMLKRQLPGYTRALWYLTKELGQYDGLDVGGFVWDVTCSKKHEDPKVLKSGLFSTAKNQRVPSWRWLKALEHLTDQEAEEYLPMIKHAAETVDPRLYHRQWGEFSPLLLAAYENELYADAVRISGWLRQIAGTEDRLWTENVSVQVNWPRIPVCAQIGGFCSYTGPCLEDSREARSSFTKRQPLRWLDKHAAKAHLEDSE